MKLNEPGRQQKLEVGAGGGGGGGWQCAGESSYFAFKIGTILNTVQSPFRRTE